MSREFKKIDTKQIADTLKKILPSASPVIEDGNLVEILFKGADGVVYRLRKVESYSATMVLHREVIPTKTIYEVYFEEDGAKTVLYSGDDETAAETIKNKFNPRFDYRLQMTDSEQPVPSSDEIPF